MKRRVPTRLDAIAQVVIIVALAFLFLAIVTNSSVLVRLAVLFLLIGLTGIVVAYLWRGWTWLRGFWTGENAIVQEIYDAIDDHLGAGRAERRKWARWQRGIDFLTFRWGRLLKPPAFRPGDIQMTGKRIYIYDLAYNRIRKPFQRWKRWDIDAFTIRYSLEVNIYIGQWFHLLEQRICMALGLEWKQGVLALEHDHATRSIRVSRKRVVAVPDRVSVHEEANGGL